ncbi:MAG: quinol:cytochrome C oxidoreductase [Tenacibaculum sp.]
MYQFTGKLKILAFTLIGVGILGTVHSFMSAPKTLEQAKEILAKQHDTHHGGHAEVSEHKKQAKDTTNKKHTTSHKELTAKTEHESVKGKHKKASSKHQIQENKEQEQTNDHNKDEHAEHAFHQMQNKPWAAFYVAMLFFLGVSLLVLAFYAAQRVAHAGWSVVLFRVMEAISNNLHYVSVFMLLFIILTIMHKNHIFPWMAEGILDPLSDKYDPIIERKSWFMNTPGWAIRSIVYLIGWNIFRYIIRKKSIDQDNGSLKLHKNLYNICVVFIVFFMITESMMSWDWIMGIDPHWFSTLFGWYVLATLLVSALTIIAMVSIYLRSKDALPFVNDSHIHDLAKFMFGFSVFWAYLWFAQFMLIWYANMPEETTYFVQRFNEYKIPFLTMVGLNFVFPVLLLINSDFKSIPWLVILSGIVILTGHYIDLFVMIMPGTVGEQWSFGIGEISAILFFIGVFIYATFSAFDKVSALPKGNPFLDESKTHHYYNIEHRG